MPRLRSHSVTPRLPADSAAQPQPIALRELAARVMGGDRDAFEQLHRRFDAGLRRLFLRRSGGRLELAEELAQRTWAEVWTSISRGHYDAARAAFSTYLYAVGYKVWLQYRRTRLNGALPTALDQFAESLLNEEASPAVFAQACELLDVVRAVLRGGDATVCELEPDERQVLHGVAQGKSERELARELRIAASTVNARKKSAYNKLRRHLARLGVLGAESERTVAVRE